MAVFSKKGLIFLSAYLIMFLSGNVLSLERSFTLNIEPGSAECFYQHADVNDVIDIEYQVINGGQGELDINFYLTAPSSRLIVGEFRKSENSHRFDVEEQGDYKFCWDNTFSHFNRKTVFFELIVEDPMISNEEDDWSDLSFNAEDIYEMKFQDIQDAISRIHAHFTKIRHIQDTLRAYEARDRNIAEGNFVRVNNWSMIQITIMLIVGIIQVIMVRSLFDDSSRVRKIWRKANNLISNQ